VGLRLNEAVAVAVITKVNRYHGHIYDSYPGV
jgi:hypothetical protein